MRAFLKIVLWCTLSLLLLFGITVATIAYWGPPVFSWVAERALRDAGFDEVVVSVEAIGFEGCALRIDQLGYQGAALSNATLTIGYNISGLRRSELESITLDHPAIVLDWPVGGTAALDAQQPRGLPALEALPERFPVETIRLQAATLMLRGPAGDQKFQIDAEMHGRKQLHGHSVLRSEGSSVEAQIESRWPELSGQITAESRIESPERWLAWSQQQGWLALPPEVSVSTTGPLTASMQTKFAERNLQLWEIDCEQARPTFKMEGVAISAETLGLRAKGDGRAFGGLELELRAGNIRWSDGAGTLSGLEGTFVLDALKPLTSNAQQTLRFASLAQGDFTTGPGTLKLSYADGREGVPPLSLEVITTALGGRVRMTAEGQALEALDLSIHIFLDSVELAAIAALFPQFDGEIEGRADGELALQLKEDRIILLPGDLQLDADTSGRFAYSRQGWLTQDPQLDPEDFVSKRAIVDIMQDAQGASALTELALLDLDMSVFYLNIREDDTGAQSVVARIEGSRTIKGVTVPVVLDVPIRGDIRETIDAAFDLNAQMRD